MSTAAWGQLITATDRQPGTRSRPGKYPANGIRLVSRKAAVSGISAAPGVPGGTRFPAASTQQGSSSPLASVQGQSVLL